MISNSYKQKIQTLYHTSVITECELAHVLIISASDGYKRAKVATIWLNELLRENKALDNEALNDDWWKRVWQKTNNVLSKLEKKFEQPLNLLRIEWIIEQQQKTWQQFKNELPRYKRNYYRAGIAFKGVREPWLLLTEAELNANACLYQGSDVAWAGVNQKNLNVYLKARHGSSQLPKFEDNMPVIIFNTAGVFINIKENNSQKNNSQQQECYTLDTAPRYKSHRKMLPLSANSTMPIIAEATNFLARQIKDSGQYVYGYFPCFNRTINTYNSLRHASSTYALIEGYEAVKNSLSKFENNIINSTNNFIKDKKIKDKKALEAELNFLKTKIQLALTYLMQTLIKHYDDKAYVIDTNEEIKLGANAVAILALVKYLQVFNPTNEGLPIGVEENTELATQPNKLQHKQIDTLLTKLANGIVAMQQADGSFVHVLHGKDLSIKQKKRIIYYDGEAAFALMRLYGLTKNERWLDCVVKAFDYFIAAKHYRAHDHWLSYCSNELIKYKPEQKYFKFAVNNIKGYTDFIKNRITTFPTLLELCMAFHNTLLTLDDYPQFYEVLDGFDVQDFYQALHTRANYLLNGYFFPEIAMYFKAPKKITHGFFIRHHAFRVRIDDVEHYLSGLIAYQQFLIANRYPLVAQKNYRPTFLEALNTTSTAALVKHEVLTKENLANSTKGRWIASPKQGWQATGLCIWSTSFKKGDLVVARGRNMQNGYLPRVAIKSLLIKGASGIVTDNADDYLSLADKYDVPVLQVQNVKQATVDIGRLARQAFTGKVIGVTGSAGKTTTVNMLAHTLGAFGQVAHSRYSANLPAGIAWNMASFSSTDDYWVLEMAIGNMSANSDLVRPNVAIITNIAAAHLEYHHTLQNVAIKKSRIFEGMNAGGLAVICRDISQYDIIEQLAYIHGLHVVSYGEHAESNIKIINWSSGTATIEFEPVNMISPALVEQKSIASSLGHNTKQAKELVTLSLQAHGKHMVLNAMAVLAVVNYYNLPLNKTVEILQGFKAVAGRGDVIDAVFNNKNITIYDEAYNANPLSMQAALNTFKELTVKPKHKIIIIGDMLELGNYSKQYHLELSEIIKGIDARLSILVGELIEPLYKKLLNEGVNVLYYKNVASLQPVLDSILSNNDHILLKSSHGMGLYRVVDYLQQ